MHERMKSLVEPGPVRTTDRQPAFTTLWKQARTAGYAVALWRLPHRTEKELLIDTTGALEIRDVDLEALPGGFAVGPFLNPDLRQTRFLRADLYWRFDEDGSLLARESRHPANHPALRALEAADSGTKPAAAPSGAMLTVEPTTDEDREAYEAMVRRAVKQIGRGEMRKVVLSRTKPIRFEGEPDVVALFNQLCTRYPAAFVSAVFLPDTGQVWLGATPERLVSVDSQGLFRTISLAGTQSAYDAEGQLKRPADAQWTQKEIEEQALVSRYIIECFKKIRLREFTEEGPRTVIAGNLMHLRTDFSVDTAATSFPQLGSVMLRLLHPTSAVCGMPRAVATDFILSHEGYDRELYSGFLGPVNLRHETNLFVNLRCMKLEGAEGTLYAGAGITEDSVPGREWRETELKCETILRALRPAEITR